MPLNLDDAQMHFSALCFDHNFPMVPMVSSMSLPINDQHLKNRGKITVLLDRESLDFQLSTTFPLEVQMESKMVCQSSISTEQKSFGLLSDSSDSLRSLVVRFSGKEVPSLKLESSFFFLVQSSLVGKQETAWI